MSDHDSENEEVADLSSPDVTTKYRAAGDIVNLALSKVLEACVDGADIVTLCELGDGIMLEETGKLYNKKVKEKKIEKGIAFPTCVSVNELVGHYSPLKGESRALKSGDLVKVDGRVGTVTWDGRPKHAFASIKWEDDGTDAHLVAAETIELMRRPARKQTTPKAPSSSAKTELTKKLAEQKLKNIMGGQVTFESKPTPRLVADASEARTDLAATEPRLASKGSDVQGSDSSTVLQGTNSGIAGGGSSGGAFYPGGQPFYPDGQLWPGQGGSEGGPIMPGGQGGQGGSFSPNEALSSTQTPPPSAGGSEGGSMNTGGDTLDEDYERDSYSPPTDY